MGVTIIVAPMPLIVPAPFISLTEIIVYVVVVLGLTIKVFGLDAILFIVTGVTPSEYVMLQLGVPVNVTVRVVLCPLHIVFDPDIEAVAVGLTVKIP